MKSTSHFALAYLLYAALKNRDIHLNRTAFVYGNIAPDYIPAMVFPPHTERVCAKSIDEAARSLAGMPPEGSGRFGGEYSKQLGIMCHYICDYFCFAHSKLFVGGLRRHAEYETALDEHLRDNWRALLDLMPCPNLSRSRSCAELAGRMEAKKSAYAANGYSFDNDLEFSFETCLSAIMAVMAMSERARATGAAPDDDPKCFATGNCYVFRAFLYKNRNNNVFYLPELMPAGVI